jgi:hypothetical protein
MDVGIRACNWLLALDVAFSLGCVARSEARRYWDASIKDHADFVESNLENKSEVPNNHFLVNLASLTIIGAYFRTSAWGKKLLATFSPQLGTEILRQFNRDGSNFEGSTCYHQLSLQAALFGVTIASKCPEAPIHTPEVLQRLESAIGFSRAIEARAGETIQIGDNDSGSIFFRAPVRRRWIGVERQLLKRIGNLELGGPESRAINATSREAISKCSMFNDFGLYVWRSRSLYLAFRAGPLGQKSIGGHGHNDQLSIVVSINGTDVIGDPGSFTYTRDFKERNKFRATAYHSTILCGSREQNPISELPRDVFLLRDKAHAKILEWNDGFVRGVHTGFGRLVSRTVSIREERITGNDRFYGDEAIIASFILCPGIMPKIEYDRLILSSRGCRIATITSPQASWTIEDITYSLEYGVVARGVRAMCTCRSNELSWFIIPEIH